MKISFQIFFGLFFLLFVLPVQAQVLQMPDSLFINVPYGENFQSIEMEYVAAKDSLYLYTAFDLNAYGVINAYRVDDPAKPKKVIRSHTYKLPYLCRHANDIQIYGDTLLVTGGNNGNISVLGFFNKYTGAEYKTIIDTLEQGWILWASYIYQDTLYQIIAKDLIVELQQYNNGDFTTIRSIRPSPMRDKYNYIQGCAVILDRILIILTSSPTRSDLFDLKDDLKYLGRYFGEDGGFESEGVSSYTRNDTTNIYYGLRFPNKINRTVFNQKVRAPETVYPENGSIISASTLSFSWKTVPSAFTYEINIAFDNAFNNIARIDTNLVNSIYISNLPGSGPYYWRTRAKNIFGASSWSTPNKVTLDLLDTSDKWIPNATPLNFSVWQNYPNPFNNSTKIKFSVPTMDLVRISVFDLSGKVIRHIVNDIVTPGIYSIDIDGKDLSSGTYFCAVETLTKKKIIKMTLLK